MARKDVLIATHCEPSLADRLRRAADASDRSQSSIIRRALREHLPKYETPVLADRGSEGLPRDGTAQLGEP